MEFNIDKIMKLARLGLTEEEKRKIESDFKDILKYFSILSEVDTENIEPLSHPIKEAKNSFKSDDIEDFGVDGKEQIIKQAPLSDGRHFKTRKVFNNK